MNIEYEGISHNSKGSTAFLFEARTAVFRTRTDQTPKNGYNVHFMWYGNQNARACHYGINGLGHPRKSPEMADLLRSFDETALKLNVSK